MICCHPLLSSPLKGEESLLTTLTSPNLLPLEGGGWVGVIYKSLTFTPSPVLLTPFGQASAKDCFIGVTAKSHSKHCYSSRHKEPTGLFVSCEPPQGRGTHKQSPLQTRPLFHHHLPQSYSLQEPLAPPQTSHLPTNTAPGSIAMVLYTESPINFAVPAINRFSALSVPFSSP